MTKAIILAGGKGKRLQPLTFSIPKPLLSFGKKTIIQLLFEQLHKYGIKDIIISTGYLAKHVQDYCQDGSQWGLNISYQHENMPLGTAGPLSLLKEQLQKEKTFLMMNGDLVTKINFNELIKFHEENKNILTVAWKEFSTQCPFGVLKMRGNNVFEIEEKPTITYKISCGIYALEALCLEYIPSEMYFTVPDLVQRLSKANLKVGAFEIVDYWKGVETLNDITEVLENFEDLQ